jgi:hypothetical protein
MNIITFAAPVSHKNKLNEVACQHTILRHYIQYAGYLIFIIRKVVNKKSGEPGEAN